MGVFVSSVKDNFGIFKYCGRYYFFINSCASCWILDIHVKENIVIPDQLASEASWSESSMFNVFWICWFSRKIVNKIVKFGYTCKDKHCRSRSAGFWSQLTRINNVFHQACMAESMIVLNLLIQQENCQLHVNTKFASSGKHCGSRSDAFWSKLIRIHSVTIKLVWQNQWSDCSELADSAEKLSIKSLDLSVHDMWLLVVIRPNKLMTK